MSFSGLEQLEQRTLFSTFVVTSTANAGAGSLRQAITDANAHTGVDVINFDIADASKVIKPTSAFPKISGDLTIDGTSQAGYTTHPLVEINGPNAGDLTTCFNIKSGAVTIKGLSITSFGGAGIVIGSAGGCTIQRNYIGVDSTGKIARGNGQNAIVIAVASNNLIGGKNLVDGNILANNGTTGKSVTGGNSSPAVLVYGGGTGNAILGNSIYDNRGLAIDLVKSGNLPDFVTPNDDAAKDADTGSNNLQNNPVLYYAGINPGGGQLFGNFTSEPRKTYRIEVFSNYNAFRNKGPAQARKFLTAANVTTDAKGYAFVNIILTKFDDGALYTLSATELKSNNTSEMSTPTLTKAGGISGNVFNDANGNGIKDTGETPLVGATVYLDQAMSGTFNHVEPSTLTDSKGNYSFVDIQGGPERVRVAPPAGYRLTYPANPLWDVTLPTTKSTKGRNFGLTQTVILGGSVFNDANSNGTQDKGEARLSGWTVFIDKDGDGVLDAGEKTRTTNSSGAYQFAGLKAGSYVVRIVPQENFKITTSASRTVKMTPGSTRSKESFGVHATA